MLNNHHMRQMRKQGYFLDTWADESIRIKRKFNYQKFFVWATMISLSLLCWFMVFRGCAYTFEKDTRTYIKV